MSLKTTKISFIGGGNMAQALIGGMLAQGAKVRNILVCDPSDTVQSYMQEKGIQTTSSAGDALAHGEVVVLAIKPQIFSAALAPLAGKFTDQLIISVAAGTTVNTISQLLGGYRSIVRCMPNTPALIQAGASGLYAAADVSDEQKALAQSIIGASGLAIWVDSEELMHAVTAVSGSAPAYFFYFLEHMIAAGTQLGLSSAQAASLAKQTALGAAQMAITSDDTPSELRRKVTSPNGTTQAAIESMQANQVGKLLEKAMQACVDRSVEMAG